MGRDGHHDDDTALLALSVTSAEPGPRAPQPPTGAHSLDTDLRSPGVARRIVIETLAGWGIEDPDTVVLLTHELVTNAVLHGGDPITLREYRLMVQQDTAHLPPELLSLLGQVQAILPDSAVPELRRGIKAAFDAGDSQADIKASVTPRQSRHLVSLHDLLTRVDAYCRDGVLLTLPLEGEVSGLRGWVVDEVARQLAGAEPRVYDGPFTT